ncbi:MAG TPA: DNA-formamidopyrimidine glycosylase family protein [Micromonosporaceae bacterium]|nr:DNA-formamidopyrimidine glycosylase family protein [Micromonosporaceae bacterium]
MPEGHTIHRLAARHRDLFRGARVAVSSPQGRFAGGASRLSGQVLRDTEAYGKHLLHHFAGVSLHVHLGLYGRFTDGSGRPPAPIGEVRLRMTGARHWLDLRGPAACDLLDPPEVRALVARLGADPLRDDSDPDAAYAKLARSRKPLGALLLDQSIVAGAGLIYTTEVLFRAAIPPTRPGRELDPGAWASLWTDLCALMREGVEHGRIDTVHSVHTPEAMRRPPRVDRHGGEVYVYRRAGQPCLVCGTAVSRGDLAGRNAYWCPACQAEPSRRKARVREVRARSPRATTAP